jgi:hypothetical protein
VEPVPGTEYGLAIFGAPAGASGPAIGALVAGIAALLVSFVVGCVALLGAASGGAGWGALGGGAFTVLTSFLGAAALGLGGAGLRRTRPQAQPPGSGVRGRGMAVAGVVCGGVAIVIALCSLGIAVVAAVS